MEIANGCGHASSKESEENWIILLFIRLYLLAIITSGRPSTIAAGELLVEKLTETGSEDIRAMTPLV